MAVRPSSSRPEAGSADDPPRLTMTVSDHNAGRAGP
jgi:hypothetical protein